MTATTMFTTSFPTSTSRSAESRNSHQPEHARSPVGRAVTGVASGAVTAAKFAGHFIAAAASVVVLGTDTEV